LIPTFSQNEILPTFKRSIQFNLNNNNIFNILTMSTKAMKPNNTAYRFQSDARQFGGLLMIMSFCCVIMPIGNIVSGIGPNGAMSSDPSEIPFWGLVAGICVFSFGVVGVLAGYMAAIHDYSHKYINMFLMVIIQTAWIGYITDMVAVSKASSAPAMENGFIPLEYEPTDTDVRFVGAMGVLGIMVYGFSFVGSMAFMVWSIHSYTINAPGDRSGSYFKGRLRTYGLVLTVAGLVQFLLGCWCQARFDIFTPEIGPVGAAFLVVTFPWIAILVGFVQLFNGLWGVARSFGVGLVESSSTPVYQISLAFQWILVVVLQILVQIAYLPGDNRAGVAPFLASFSLGLTLMPAYLDHKANTLPETFPKDYYDNEMQEAAASRVNEMP